MRAKLPLVALSSIAFWVVNSHPLHSPPVPSKSPIAATVDNGRPQLDPLPASIEIWECEVAVIGGSLGGIAAAAQAMQSGATTCLIEVSPWLGGQISAQGVSAIDESLTMRDRQNFSPNWQAFKQLIENQPVSPSQRVADINRCWVGDLCFPPQAGATAARDWLRSHLPQAPQSRWSTQTAFKGAQFDDTGREITAIYAVKRRPRNRDYLSPGRLSRVLYQWYSWSSDDMFDKTPLKLQPPPGRRMLVIDATDTGELVGWANFPHRLGSESHATTGEMNAAPQDNPSCTQAFTYPFVLEIGETTGTKLLNEPQGLRPSRTRKRIQPRRVSHV